MIQVTINGFVCDRETADNMFEVDGKGDEMGFTWSVAADGTKSADRSLIYGDVNGHPERIRAGSRSDKGGIKSGDVVPNRSGQPAWSSEPADGFPILVWKGEVAPGTSVRIAPLVWELDDSYVNPQPVIETINTIATSIASAAGYGAIAAVVGKVVSALSGMLGVAGDRPIGADLQNPNPDKTDWPILEITNENLPALLATDLGHGRGVVPMSQTDPSNIGGGSYRFFVQVIEVSIPLEVRVHLQDIGDAVYREDELAGTRGQARRLEGFQIDFSPPVPDLGLKYMAHLEGIGDVAYVTDGEFVGTRGESRRLEGFAIELTGPAASSYTVEYMAHVQNIGDTPFVRDGEFCGTRGQSLRVEGILVRVVRR